MAKRVELTSFILCAEPEFDKIKKTLCECFKMPSDEEGNTLKLTNRDIELEMAIFTKGTSDEVKEFIEKQVNTVAGHFHEVETKFIDIKINVLHQIRFTNGFVSVHYSFEEDNTINKEGIVLKNIVPALKKLQGVLLVEQGSILLDENASVILSDDGRSELKKYMPYEKEVGRDYYKGITLEQIERRNRSLEEIKKREIFVTNWLPFIENKGQAAIRTPKEIAERAIAFMAVSVYSECLLSNEMSTEKAREFVQNNIIEPFKAESFFSPKEKEYLENKDSKEEERIAFSWQYENLYVMEWALGFIKELPYPDKICDVALTVQILREYNSVEEILKDSQLRSADELLDAADFIYCLDWACVDARVYRLPAPAEMDEGVVMERHKSFNWLIGAERAEWDDIDIST